MISFSVRHAKSVTVVDTISTTVIFYFPLVLGAYRVKMGVFRSFSALTGCTAPSPQPGADQHQGGAPVRECPHHTGAPTDLPVQPLDHVVCADARPVLAGEIAVGQRLLHAAADKFPDLTLDHFLVQLYDLLGYGLLSPFRMVCGIFIHPEPASYVFFFALFQFAQLIVPYPIPPDCPRTSSTPLVSSICFPLIQKKYYLHNMILYFIDRVHFAIDQFFDSLTISKRIKVRIKFYITNGIIIMI